VSSTSNQAGEIPTPEVPQEVVATLQGLRTPVLIAHVVPDADALGAMFAMARAWAADSCRPKVALPPDSLSQRLGYLFEQAEVNVATPDDFAAADGFVVLDTARKDRSNVGPAWKETDWSSGRPLVNIDHHGTNTHFGDIDWVVEDASSTCELVFFLLCAADRPITPVTASLLYAGILTDTLGFSLPTTSAAALTAAAQLVRLGASVGDWGERLCRSQQRSEFDLVRVIYANTEVLASGRLAYSSASHKEIVGAGCTAADIDEQINIPRSLDGVQLAMLFTEGDPGKTRINFRASGKVTVQALAIEFGGGGHLQASGAVLACGLEEAVEKVVPRAVEYLEEFQRPQ
jgi:phosphoesterase RecJ-like protein